MAAFGSLREIGGQAVMDGLLPLTGKDNDAAVRQEAVLALAALDLEKATQPLMEVLSEFTKEDAALEFWRSLLGVKGASAALAKALPHSGLAPVMAKAGLRVAREGGRNETELIVALTRGADLESEGLGLTDAEMKQIAAKVGTEGDAAKGETIFRRKDIGCVSCHAIGGVGGKVGPDLTSIGASAQVDYLIESVFYPNRKIKEGYHSVLVETKDGDELLGHSGEGEQRRTGFARRHRTRKLSIQQKQHPKPDAGEFADAVGPGGFADGRAANGPVPVSVRTGQAGAV